MALKQFFTGKGCTVLLLDDRTSEEGDMQLQSIAHGVIALDQLSPLYGAQRRRLRVLKLRGVDFRGGYHDFTIETGGLVVFPRLVAADHRQRFAPEPLSAGVPEIDALMGGGIDPGTSMLMMGPAGTGKSTVTLQFALANARRGKRSVLFAFDENVNTLVTRAAAVGLDLEREMKAGLVEVRAIDPAELSPGEFSQAVREAVEQRGVNLVIIDSLNGYMHAMPEEQYLTLQLHELLMYLAQMGVATMLVVAQHGFLGSMHSPLDVKLSGRRGDAVPALRGRWAPAQGDLDGEEANRGARVDDPRADGRPGRGDCGKAAGALPWGDDGGPVAGHPRRKK